MGADTPRARRGALTLLARTALSLLLLLQLAVLWVIAHPAPTRLPAGVIGALAELGTGRMDFECREATVDRRGRIRLGGVRLSDSLHPADAITADIDVLPDWRAWLRGEPGILGLQVRGRATLGEPGAEAALDDFVVRLAPGDGQPQLQAAARAGSTVLRLDLVAADGRGAAGDGALAAAPVNWDRALAMDGLRALRSVHGAIGVRASSGRVDLDGAFVDNPAAMSPLPLHADRGDLRGRWDGHLRAELRLAGLHGPSVDAARIWITLGDGLRFRALAEDIRHDGLADTCLDAVGVWRPGRETEIRFQAATATSRLAGQVRLTADSIRLREVDARLSAADLTRIAPLAQVARQTGVDLAGHIELLGAEMVWSGGELVSAQGSLALAKTGWHVLRPALVQPDEPAATFRGDLALDLPRNRLALTHLDLAGIHGEIEGGLRAGDTFVLRLNSTEGHPVNPSCLNALLGPWWIDLWSRFDLSTHGVLPHADVRVAGRWGAAESIRTEVRARLEHFGFMGARFRSTDVWVSADADATLVRIASLRGELNGQDAGEARGTVRWDWRRPEWQGRPQVDAEGDLLPACALRLHDAALAAALRDWTFAQPQLRVALGPDRPLHVTLSAPGESTLGSIKVRQLRLTATQASPGAGDLTLEATGELSGGKAALAITGDLAKRNHVQISVREWSRSGAEALVAQLRNSPAPKASPDASQLTVLYSGTCDFSAPWETVGEGRATLLDPTLKTVHLLGPLSEGLDALGLGFSSYPLNRAEVTFRCAQGQTEVNPLKIEGDDAVLKLKGLINLRDGGLNLAGQIYLKDSPWGFLKYINPNRLIAKMIDVKVTGTVQNPKIGTKSEDKKINK